MTKSLSGTPLASPHRANEAVLLSGTYTSFRLRRRFFDVTESFPSDEIEWYRISPYHVYI
jgi:hypothetical protein